MSKAKTLREKNIVTKLVKDLNKRMGDFETAVEELKILKETIVEMHDEIKAHEAENLHSIIRLKSELKDNKTKILNEAAESIGKVIVSKDYLEELNEEVEKLKNAHKNNKESVDTVVSEKVDELIEHRLKLQELKNEADVNILKATINNYKNEIDNMNKTFNRMSKELESQKELTSNLALASRPNSNTTN